LKENFQQRLTRTKCDYSASSVSVRRLPASLTLSLVVAAVGLLLLGNSVDAADELLPPFGFRWKDSMPRVEAVLNGAKAKIVAREKKENREVWTVEGLIHPGLKRTL